MADGAGKTQGHAQPAAACRAAEPGSGHAKAGPAGRKEDAIAAERERVPRRRREAVPADGRIARRGREHADDGRAVGTDVQENRRDREVGEALEGESERIVTREISKPGRPTQRGTAGQRPWLGGRQDVVPSAKCDYQGKHQTRGEAGASCAQGIASREAGPRESAPFWWFGSSKFRLPWKHWSARQTHFQRRKNCGTDAKPILFSRGGNRL